MHAFQLCKCLFTEAVLDVPKMYGDSLPFDSFSMLTAWDDTLFSGELPLMPKPGSARFHEEVDDLSSMKTAKTKFESYVS
jgi:hypothetical protein